MLEFCVICTTSVEPNSKRHDFFKKQNNLKIFPISDIYSANI